MTRLILPGGQTYGYGYDAAGRLTQVVMLSGAVHTFTYSPVGAPKRSTGRRAVRTALR